MDISKQFSFTDFIAYFFPGAFAIIGIYFLLLLTPAQTMINNITLDVTTGIAFLTLSYIVGIVSSGFSRDVIKQIERVTKPKDPQAVVSPGLFSGEIINIFRELMGINKEEEIVWSPKHFSLCRAFVVEKMPWVTQRLERLADLALFRRNLVFPLFIWMVAGIGWGIGIVNNGIKEWGIFLIIASVMVSFFAVRTTIKRMYKSEEREVQYMYLSFIAGYKMGLFKRKDQT